MNIDVFRKLFVHRPDVYAIQTPNRTYVPVHEDLTDRVISGHLKGMGTIGLYQIIPEQNTLKWAVVDIDINKDIFIQENFDLDLWLPDLRKQAELIQTALTEHEIPSYLEFSGFKGYHVWIFFDEPVASSPVYVGLHSIMKNIELVNDGLHWEIFPKQKSVSEGSMGSLVKGPEGKHQHSGKASEFIDTVDLKTIEYADIKSLIAAHNTIDVIFEKCSALRNLRTKAFTTGVLTNEERLNLAYILINASSEYDTQDGEKYLLNSILPKLGNYKKETSEKNIQRMKGAVGGAGYKPITCAKLQETGMCPGPCAEIGTKRSPIYFYKKALGFSEGALLNVEDPFDNLIRRGNSYYEQNLGEDGAAPTLERLCNYIVDLQERVVVDDGTGDEYTYLKGIIKTDADGVAAAEFKMPPSDFHDNNAFKSHITDKLGIDGIFTKINAEPKIRQCIAKYSNTVDKRVVLQMGYRKDEEEDRYPDKYISPSVIIDKTGIHENTSIEFDLEDADVAKYLNIIEVTNEEFNEAKQGLNNLLSLSDWNYTHSALAHTMLPIIAPFLSGEDTKFTYFVRGNSGDGKSYIMKFFQNFYGNFTNLASWTSTFAALSRIGHLFKDALYVIDDFKRRNLGRAYDQALTLMQTYADNTSRSRARPDMAMQKTFTIKGWLACTGEDTPDGEASTLARSIQVNCLPGKKDRDLGRKVESVSHLFSGITGRYIHHVLKTNPLLFDRAFQSYETLFYEEVKGLPNDTRITRNISLLMTSYKFISEFFWSKKVSAENQEKFKEYLLSKIKEQAVESAEEMSSEKFIEQLSLLIGTESVILLDDTTVPVSLTQYEKGRIIGWNDLNNSEHTYIIGSRAYALINSALMQQNMSLGHSLKAMMLDMYTKGYIKDQKLQSLIFNKRKIDVIVFNQGVI